MTSTPSRVHRPHQHLDPHLRRILEFAVAHPHPGPAQDENLRRIFDISHHEYELQLRAALAAQSTSPEEIALADIVRARADDQDQPDPATRTRSIVIGKSIRIHGKTFIVELDMAEIFLRHATRVFLSGNSDLVLLRHTRGVEMIPITRSTPYDVTDIVCDNEQAARVSRREHDLQPKT